MRSLVVLAEERHFTRAAQRLHIAQPALSQQIAKLEREVGVPLVDRTTRRVALTEAGEVLLAHARRMLTEEAVALAELDDLAGVRRGSLSVGAAQAMGPVNLATLLAEFHGRYPAVELTVQESLSISLNAAVLADELELAFVTAVTEGANMESHEVASEDLVLIMAPNHRLAHRPAISLASLRDESFVMFAGSATIRRQVESLAQAYGFVPQVGFQTSDITRIRSLVAAGLGVAVVPRSDAEARGPQVRTAQIADRALVHRVHLCWRRGRRHSPAAQAFIDLTLERRQVVADSPATIAAVAAEL
ncbi:HTH-type transcriptional regulator CynR [Paraconexibacter sp. AEG42_29]|uniref:HTH-type transcriptional regulator CynR n=2 Tax=Paraconexibacter sp. AEG42_29 TaxID=2997339 RepID=A0AAU7ATH6_9ACTN